MPQPPVNKRDQEGRSDLMEIKLSAAQNPWLASFLLRQVRQVQDLQHQVRLYLYWLWSRGQAAAVWAYRYLKAMRPGKRLVRSTATGAAILLASAGPVLAGTIVVNSTTDDGTGCTLREAIIAANTDADHGGCTGASGDDIIDLTTVSGTISLTSTLPLITGTVQLNGPGAANLTIDGGGSFNALEGDGAGIGVDGLTVSNVSGDGTYTTESITVTNSTITGSNCGLYSGSGSVVVENSTITGQGCDGISAYSSATITDSMISGEGGYGVYVYDGPATITGSTISGADYGVLSFGDALVTNSVITGTAENGVDSYATVTVISSTVVGGNNGLYSFTSDVMVESSTITGLSDDGVDANEGNATVINSRVVGGEAGVDTDTGAITVTNSTIIGAGAGIDATASATVVSSTVTGGTGNGVNSYTSSATVSYSTVTGGVVGVNGPLNITINSSTVSGSGQHGVQSLNGQIMVSHSTIVNNGGNGINNNAGTTTLHHTIVAQNAQSGTTRDLNGTVDASSSYNLIGNGDGTGISNGTNGNLVGSTGDVIDSALGPLQDNGGPTETYLPDPDSPAIDAGDPGFSSPPDFDQRGSGFPRVKDRVDIGAIEALLKVRQYVPVILKD